MKITPKYLMILCGALLFVPVHADEILVQYAFAGLQGDEHELAPERAAPGMVAGALYRGKGLNYLVKVPDTFAANGWTTSEQANSSDYVEFEVGAGNAEFTLVALEFEEFSNAKGPEFFEVRSSLDEFREPLVSAVETLGPGGNESYDILLNFGRSLANLQSAITLRFYGYDRGQSTDQSGIWVITNPVDGLAVVDGDVRKSNN